MIKTVITIMYDIVCYGELLWDMLPNGKVVGGAPFNISNRAQSLGTSSVVLTSVGDDELGKELVASVSEKGNSTDYIQVHPALATSTVDVVVSNGGEPTYTINYPVAWDDIRLSEYLIEAVGHAKMFVYSSLGLRDKRSRQVLFELLKYAKIKVCDINLREGHYDKSTIIKMLEEADILRMNEFELKMAAQWLGIKYESFKEGVIKISDHFGYQGVVATLGGEGAMSYTDKIFYHQDVFNVSVVDTVGAGDAFLATYLSELIKGTQEADALRKACAVGALTASKPGGTPEISSAEIELLLNQ